MHTEAPHPEREIHTTRLLKARPDQVFNAWADPVRLARWWGPKGFSNTFSEFDFRPGGDWRFVMHGPNGVDYPNHWIYRKVDRDHLVLDHVVAPKFRLTATLAEEAGGTRLTWVACSRPPPSASGCGSTRRRPTRRTSTGWRRSWPGRSDPSKAADPHPPQEPRPGAILGGRPHQERGRPVSWNPYPIRNSSLQRLARGAGLPARACGRPTLSRNRPHIGWMIDPVQELPP